MFNNIYILDGVNTYILYIHPKCTKKVCVFVFLFYLYMFRVKYKQWDQAEMYYLEPSLWQEEIQMMMYYFPLLCSNSKCWVVQMILQMPNWAL